MSAGPARDSGMAGVPSVSPLEEDGGTSSVSAEQVPSTVTAAGAVSCEAAPGEDAILTAAAAAAPAMSLLRMEEKFSSGQYRAIGDFVTDFKTMLEGCYQLHGADHWLSKQAQKLELMLEQKLALLSR